MFNITHLMVEGFRGFRETEEFNFTRPITELFGENRTGKSSTLNAIEWVLFGDECCGKQTGIRERIGWIVPNRHLAEPAVRVQLQMEGPEGTYVIVRMLRWPPRKASGEETLELTLPDEITLTGDAAGEKLEGLLQSSFRDFLTTVYQHQEAIRAILTQEPKDRNDAIDRLLGLSDQRNLLAAIDGADLRGRQRDMGKDFTAFEEQIQAGLAARERDLAVLRQEAQEAGLARNQLAGKAALDMARKSVEDLERFCEEVELDLPHLNVPETWAGLAEFDKLMKKTIVQLRGQVPGIEEQKKLLQGKQSLLELKTAWESSRQQWADLIAKRGVLDKGHGCRKAIDVKTSDTIKKLEAEQTQLRQTNGRAAVVNEAIEFLDDIGNEKAPCPVCETAVPGLTDKLKSLWATKLKTLAERVTVKINAHKARLKELRGITAQYQKLDDDADVLTKDRTDLREKSAALLNKQLGDEDDPFALAVIELKRLDSRLKQLSKAIQERQDRLDAIERDLSLVRLIRDYLHQGQKKQVLETIQQSSAFKELEAVRDQVAQLVEDVAAIKDAVAKLAREEAETRLGAASDNIDKYFRQLSRHPAVQQLKLTITTDKRTNRNAYEITDQDENDLMPLLSQGDLNAMALAIFLGLSVTAGDANTFGCLLLDDPSQSLGTEHKKELARLLDRMAAQKKIIVATMDVEFRQLLAENTTKSKTEYHFGSWTPEQGPQITATDNPHNCGKPSPSRLVRQANKVKTQR